MGFWLWKDLGLFTRLYLVILLKVMYYVVTSQLIMSGEQFHSVKESLVMLFKNDTEGIPL